MGNSFDQRCQLNEETQDFMNILRKDSIIDRFYFFFAFRQKRNVSRQISAAVEIKIY